MILVGSMGVASAHLMASPLLSPSKSQSTSFQSAYHIKAASFTRMQRGHIPVKMDVFSYRDQKDPFRWKSVLSHNFSVYSPETTKNDVFPVLSRGPITGISVLRI